MTFEEVVDQASAMLQRRGRVTYRLLKRQFNLDDEALEDLKEELIYGQKLAADEDGRVLVWTGAPPPDIQEDSHTPMPLSPAEPHPLDAERRQLTVMFCDLMDSTALATKLDPEDLREVVRAYQEACAQVIARYEGHIAQYLGDGLLVYFGYPLAHEDDAQRAVRAGLGMVEALGQLNTRLGTERGVHLAVRLGIHTGLVVVGDVGGGARQEQLALGETPNLAARLQCIAAPNTLVISAATLQLLGGFFACQARAGRGCRRAFDRAGLSNLGGHGNELVWVGAGYAGPGRGGEGTGPPGDRRLAGYWGSTGHPILVHLAGGRLCPSGPHD